MDIIREGANDSSLRYISDYKSIIWHLDIVNNSRLLILTIFIRFRNECTAASALLLETLVIPSTQQLSAVGWSWIWWCPCYLAKSSKYHHPSNCIESTLYSEGWWTKKKICKSLVTVESIVISYTGFFFSFLMLFTLINILVNFLPDISKDSFPLYCPSHK